MNKLLDIITRPLFTLPLPSTLINTLSKYGFTSYEDLLDENGACHPKVGEILSNMRLTWDDVKIASGNPKLKTVNQVLKSEAIRFSIPTFSQVLDSKLGGGISTDNITHICGTPGSGKTQLCLQLCVNVQIPTCLCGLAGEAVYIDTDCGFTVSRIAEIAEAVVNHCQKVAQVHNLNEEIQNFTLNDVLNKVHYISIRTVLELLSSIYSIENLISTHPKIKLIVIDSIIFPFLTMTNTLERTKILSTIITHLRSLSIKYELSIVITNHVTTKISGNNKSLAPSLGESFSHMVPTTLCLAKVGDNYTATLLKSNELPDSVVVFKITQEGIRDN